MIIVVDGYNVLKQLVKTNYATEKQRQWFIASLSSYAYSMKHSIVIIFDGGSHKWPTWTKRGQVSILFSGTHQSADDCIKEFIEENKGREMLVVSTDRAITNFALRYNVYSIDSLAFYSLVQERLQDFYPVSVDKGNNRVYKTSLDKEEDLELDALMQQAGKMAVYKQEDLPAHQRNSSNKELSKKQKRLLKVIKKM
jgi:predicted RNA-binding protein with PIN domain